MRKLTLTLLAVFSLALFASCGGDADKDNGGKTDADKDKGTKTEETAENEESKKLTLFYVASWDSSTATANVAKAVLQEKLGYEVTLKNVDKAIMWEGVGAGDADAMVSAWLPTLHKPEMDKLKDKVEDLGPNYVGTRSGLVVPTYVTIDSIAEMNEHADKFNGQITGIDPGAGMMATTKDAIEKYELSDMKLVASSGTGMATQLDSAYKAENWIVVTGWSPHWIFGKYDLKFLEDPKALYGGIEEIHTIVRNGLKNDAPKAYAFLDAFQWKNEDISQVMVSVKNGTEPYQSAKNWIEENEDKVNGWLK